MALNISTGTPGAATPAAGAHPPHHSYYERRFLEIQKPLRVYNKFGSQSTIEKHRGNIIVYTKVDKLPTLEGTPITEGVIPTEQLMQTRRIQKDVNQYGGFIKTTDRLTNESINGITAEFTTRVGEQAAETMNLVERNDLLGGSIGRFSNGVVDQDSVVTSALALDFQFMFTALKNARAKFITRMTGGSENVGTSSVFGAYVVIVPVEAAEHLEALDDGRGKKFVHISDYSSQVQPFENEYGTFKNFRFILDDQAQIQTNGITGRDIARCLVFAKDAYATVTVDGNMSELFIKAKGSAGTLDPIDQHSSIGWKAMSAAAIKQPTSMFRYEFALN